MKKTKELFDTETGKFMANIALKVNTLEKKIFKKGNSEQIITFYNEIYNLCEVFENDINNIELIIKTKYD